MASLRCACYARASAGAPSLSDMASRIVRKSAFPDLGVWFNDFEIFGVKLRTLVLACAAAHFFLGSFFPLETRQGALMKLHARLLIAVLLLCSIAVPAMADRKSTRLNSSH